ncbi:BppU family phage baseplate upper protein [Bacillus mycoides]|uniref:BppU family phage baseplate upper protein n=1 Tax=Bacillus mycoides TaxID=1405 RepID=UPI0025A0D3B1|nr:BppU family phage baseplate upper protein [Bacillus mycoides]MDM5429060.1 BppU family phage baseplate upper protein [Bacillus mycoides]
MTFKTHEITVDLVNDVSTTVARFSQGDQNSAKLILNLTSKGEELDLSQATAVRITFKKPDGTTVFQEDCQPINVMKAKYQIVLKTQTLAAVGNVYGQVHIIEGDRKLDTEPFVFAVKQSFSNDAAVESTNEFTIIKKAIEAGEVLKDVDIPALIASKTTAEAAKKKAAENAVQIGDLQKSLSKQDVKTQTLQHGANLGDATVASPLNVEVQGRTLVNLLGQTTLDPTKYYLFMPNKGTTKIIAGGNSYDNIAKFTGQSAISYTIKQDLRGKVSGSTLENGNIIKRTSFTTGASTEILGPSEFSIEPATSDYAILSTLDGTSLPISNSTNLAVSQMLVSFDVIRTLQDKYGVGIWQGKTALADKITIAKQLIVDYTAILYANGSGPKGNKVYVQRWIPSTSTWFGSTVSTENNPTKIQTGSSNVQEIDNNGFINIIAYADASDGTRPSVVNIDYPMFELKIKMDSAMIMLEDALYEVDQATYNKMNVDPEFSGQKLADKFPYVEGIKHLNPVVIVEGTNLIPPFIEGTLHPNMKVIGPYELELNPTTPYQASGIKIPCLPNQKYTFSSDATQTGIYFVKEMDANGSQIRQIFSGQNEQFSTGPNAKFIKIEMSNRTVEKFTFIKPMLVLGDTPKPFVSRNPSYLYTNILLAGQNGVNDVLYQEEGQWKALRRWVIDKKTNTITALPKPVIENVQVEGDLVVDGLAQVTVDSGVVVREKVNFDAISKKGVLNKDSAKIIAVYKELESELFTTYEQNGQTYPQLINNADAAKNYYVTYLLMNKHKYTTNAVDVKSTYNQSIRSAVDELTVKQADNSTGISILRDIMTDVLARVKANSL